MNKRQYTIMGLLIAAAGLHIWMDSNAKSSFKQFLTITPQNWQQIGSATISAYMMWFIALASMLLLSDYAPRLAMWIAILIFAGAVLLDAGPIATFIQNTAQYIQSQQPGAAPHPGPGPQ